MSDRNHDKVQAELTRAIQSDAPHTFEEAIPVLVTLDNGVKYKGVAYEVQPKSHDFPKGLVMVHTANTDIGVPVSYIKGR
jgi:hypothetical protein